MGGGGGSGNEKDAAATRRHVTTTVKRTTTTSSTSTTSTTLAPAAGGGGSGRGGGGGTGTNNGGGGGGTQNTTAPTTAPAAPAPSISASFSGVAQCLPNGPSDTTVELSWSTTNATSVNVDGFGTQAPNGSLSVGVNCASVGGNGSVGLLAQGPGGRAGTTAYFGVNRSSNQ
jgi:hypothetical protein